MGADFEKFRATRFFQALDGLRCASIFAVTAYHCAWPVLGLNRWGAQGVTLFFAISGFLITTLLLRERDSFGSISLGNFYARRSLRIFPLYYAVLILYCILIFHGDRGSPKGREFFHNLGYFLTYTANWGVRPGARFYLAWSLATEEQFYLFWPFVVALSRRRNTPLLVICGVLAFVLVMRLLITAHAVNFGRIGNAAVTSMSPAICMGCILAYGLHRRRSFQLLALLFGTIPGVLLCLTAACVALAVFGTPAWIIETVAVLLVGCAVVAPPAAIAVILANPVARYFGTISYGMYLFNLISAQLVYRLFPNHQTLYTIGSFLLAGAIASVSYFTYERAFLRLKSRFSRRTPLESRTAEPAIALAAGDPPA